MNYIKLTRLREKIYFTSDDVAETLGIKQSSALILCNRYVKNGLFIRLKRDMYVMSEEWKNYSNINLYKISNILNVPSYISLMTALSFYEVTTQVQKNVFENISLKRSASINVKGIEFNYYKIARSYYFDFTKKDSIFIASKEKAFLDAVYLYSFGKYAFDIDSIDMSKFDKRVIGKILKLYPERTQKMVRKLCRI
jgi:predicted transcriptional regulator of viral defense system